MAKEPRKGRVKTRLTPYLSAEEAASLYQALLEDVLTSSQEVSGVQRLVAFHPPSARAWFGSRVGRSYELLEQHGPDLAERMVQVFETLFARGHPAVILRNSDSPDLPPSHLQRAIDWLSDPQIDLVLGPDLGGGYYLIGLARPCAALFREVAMSTLSMREATLAIAAREGLQSRELPEWLDIDHPQDLARLEQQLEGQPTSCSPATRRWFAGRPPGREEFPE